LSVKKETYRAVKVPGIFRGLNPVAKIVLGSQFSQRYIATQEKGGEVISFITLLEFLSLSLSSHFSEQAKNEEDPVILQKASTVQTPSSSSSSSSSSSLSISPSLFIPCLFDEETQEKWK
ncbi:hypothetical protein U1Q18_013120, partial [Sarracenia purpurea var. burkii]